MAPKLFTRQSTLCTFGSIGIFHYALKLRIRELRGRQMRKIENQKNSFKIHEMFCFCPYCFVFLSLTNLESFPFVPPPPPSLVGAYYLQPQMHVEYFYIIMNYVMTRAL